MSTPEQPYPVPTRDGCSSFICHGSNTLCLLLKLLKYVDRLREIRNGFQNTNSFADTLTMSSRHNCWPFTFRVLLPARANRFGWYWLSSESPGRAQEQLYPVTITAHNRCDKFKWLFRIIKGESLYMKTARALRRIEQFGILP